MTRDDSIWVHLGTDEKKALNDICEYLNITKAQFIRIFIDYVYNRTYLGNGDPDIYDLADRHNVTRGVIADMIGGYE